jgi:CheY-like chemotaxis protein
MLRKRNRTVLEAPDGLTAVEMVRTAGAGIAVIVLDITLPGISGLQVLEEVRKIRSDARVILTSAYSREMVLPAGHACDFIRKPFRIEDLMELLEER